MNSMRPLPFSELMKQNVPFKEKDKKEECIKEFVGQFGELGCTCNKCKPKD